MIHHFMRYPGDKAKAVTFSYDDGSCHDIRLAEICNRYGIKCTFNLNSGLMSSQPGNYKLCPEEIREHILAAGHEIAVHGHGHIAPGVVRPLEAIDDILTCRKELERTFDIIIRGMAYPNSGIKKLHKGNTYENIRSYVENLDIAYSRSLSDDNNTFRLPEDWLNWIPTTHHKNPQIFEWIDEFVALDVNALFTANRYPRLFYMWGHSHEFNNANNWDRLEAICEKLGGKEDIWYPTNIELREYVRAYDSLIYNADTTKIYNPSCQPVWVNFADKVERTSPNHTYCIQPGQTIHLHFEEDLTL